jgi:hypothetical protein
MQLVKPFCLGKGVWRQGRLGRYRLYTRRYLQVLLLLLLPLLETGLGPMVLLLQVPLLQSQTVLEMVAGAEQRPRRGAECLMRMWRGWCWGKGWVTGSSNIRQVWD